MILSICIPSYNRWEALNKNLQSIKQAKSEDFEIVIVDNCSPQDPEKMLDLSDSRIRVVKREKAVSGQYNVANCLTFAKGKYALLCLDKDMVLGTGIDRFIECLKNLEDMNIKGGVCSLNVPEDEGTLRVVEKDAILEFGYMSIHATGPFLKTDIVKEYQKVASEEMQNSGFSYEYYLAKCASLGAMLHYEYPLLTSRLDNYSEDDKKESGTSLAYSEKDSNLYFFPLNRIQELFLYIRALSDLDLEKSICIKKIKQLYVLTIKKITIEFKSIVGNEDQAFHYHFRRRDIDFKEMLMNVVTLNQRFMKEQIENLTILQKYSVVTWSVMRVGFMMIRARVKKILKGRRDE